MRKKKLTEYRRRQLTEGLFNTVVKMISLGKSDKVAKKLGADPELQKAMKDYEEASKEALRVSDKLRDQIRKFADSKK